MGTQTQQQTIPAPAPAQPDNKPATLAQSQRQSVQRYGDDRALALEMRSLRRSLPGLAQVDDADLGALVIASKFSNLNPYAGEIYMIPGKGVMTASKIKAADAVAAAAKRGDTLSISFDRVNPDTALYVDLALEDGDTAYQCRIISSKARQAWYNHRLAVVNEMRALGYSRPEMESALAEQFPHPPEYTAVGVVKKAENFGDASKKAEVFSRADRARKRALIKCLNVNGLAAPDQRSYGGVALAEEDPVDGQYTVSPAPAKTPSEIQAEIEPEWAAAMNAAQESEIVAEELYAAQEPEHETPAHSAQKPAPMIETLRVRAIVARSALQYKTDARKASDPQRKLAFAALQEACAGNDLVRHMIQKAIADIEHFRDAPDYTILALIDWLKPAKNGDGKYHPSASSVQDVAKVVAEQNVAAGQQSLI